MNPKHNLGFVVACLLAASGEMSVDDVIDTVICPKCSKCGHQVESINALFTPHRICAPCVMGVERVEAGR